MGLFDKHSEAQTLEELKAEWAGCQQCPLWVQRTQVVMGAGANPTVIFAVGQAPGNKEDEEGIPFIGEGGQESRTQFDLIGVPAHEVFWTNALACKPLKGLSIRDAWVQHCWDRLEAELRITRPKMIVAMGRPATARFIRKLPAKGVVHGQRFTYEGIPGVTTVHPAALLRTRDDRSKRGTEKDLRDDFVLVKELYGRVRAQTPIA